MPGPRVLWRAILATLLGAVILLGVTPSRVRAAVLCQKGKRVRVRSLACAGKEQPVTLDADSLPDVTADVTSRVTEVEAVASARLAAADRRLNALESGVPLPACSETAPACGGACPAGEVCSSIVTTTKLDCACIPGLVGCNADLAPTCGPGTCPTPSRCQENTGYCNCTTTQPPP
jgi:hypothetical protein